jgi:tetratricopeptide (TPR) repeat protein
MYHLPFRKGDDAMFDGNGKIKEAYLEIFHGDYEKAIEAFKKAIEQDPDNASFYYKLSITCARSNKLDAAINAAEIAHSLEPEEPRYKIHLDMLRSRERCNKAKDLLDDPIQTTHAITLLKQALKLDPLNTNGYLLLGLAYARLGDYDKAIRISKRLLKLEPEHSLGKKLLEDYQKSKEDPAGQDH